jgi:DNA-binding IclR family transcriptional regulator
LNRCWPIGSQQRFALAHANAIPAATAHRQITTLVAEGFLKPAGYGRHIAGPRLRHLLGIMDDIQVMANVAAPMLHRLAARFGGAAQMGTYENEMVTYRVKTGETASELFTKVDMQLEAYCSGMGKVLLSGLPAAELETYLAGGPFVALTDATITDPAKLARNSRRLRNKGLRKIAARLRKTCSTSLCPFGALMAKSWRQFLYHKNARFNRI